MPALIRRIGKKGITFSVQVNELDGRPRISLGRVTADQAREAKRAVGKLAAVAQAGGDLDLRTRVLVEGLGQDLRDRLADLGLLAPVEPAPRVGAWLDRYLSQRTDLRPSSLNKLAQTMDYLKRYFDIDLTIDRINPGDATDWRLWLGQFELAEATIRLHCRNVKTIFGAAAERELIPSNPFRKLKSSSIAGDREYIVSMEVAAKVLVAAPPDQDTGLVFALARYAGLRVPSETDALKWTDVDFELGRLHIYGLKTSTPRVSPIVPELAKVLQTAFERAEAGSKYVVENIRGLSSSALHHRLQRILKRAGVPPWPDLFQQLRRDCESDWVQRAPSVRGEPMGRPQYASERAALPQRSG